MIRIATGFNIGSPEPLDSRTILSKTEMLNINEAVYPEHFYILCSDDDKLYTYNKDNIKDAVTGKFRVVDNGLYSATEEQINASVVAHMTAEIKGEKGKDGKDGTSITIWTGTQEEYDALGTYDGNVLYTIIE